MPAARGIGSTWRAKNVPANSPNADMDEHNQIGLFLEYLLMLTSLFWILKRGLESLYYTHSLLLITCK